MRPGPVAWRAMAKERLKSPRARLFVALDLPDEFAGGIVAWGREELADPALRPVAPESLHITLAFLGHRPEKEIERIAAVIAANARPGAVGRAARPGRSGRRGGGPALFALPALSPGAEALQAGVARGWTEAGFYEPEKRPFWPHVTVARVRPEGRGSRRPAVVARAAGDAAAAALGAGSMPSG